MSTCNLDIPTMMQSVRTLGLIPWPLVVVEAFPNAFETKAYLRRKRSKTSHHASTREMILVTQEEGPGMSHDTRSPPPTIPDYISGPRKGIGGALHSGKCLVGTVYGQFELLHVPMMVKWIHNMTRVSWVKNIGFLSIIAAKVRFIGQKPNKCKSRYTASKK